MLDVRGPVELVGIGPYQVEASVYGLDRNGTVTLRFGLMQAGCEEPGDDHAERQMSLGDDDVWRAEIPSLAAGACVWYLVEAVAGDGRAVQFPGDDQPPLTFVVAAD